MVVTKKKTVVKKEEVDLGVPIRVKKVKGGFNYYYKGGEKKFVTRAEYFK